MPCARLGLYVFCRRSLFEQCYELQLTFQLLLQRPDLLALNLHEIAPFTDRLVGDTGPFHLVSGIEEIAGIINFRMHQVYQARMMSHHFSDYSEQNASIGGPSKQNGPPYLSSEHDDIETDLKNLPSGEQPLYAETPNLH
ncbi:hypothetical protein L1987_87903 [Smallanthus sonchifolius]|nr:hypothetical protein L1987_87903 [Smallanthus sonchifolius]